MNENSQIQFTKNGGQYRVQKVKNYDAESIENDTMVNSNRKSGVKKVFAHKGEMSSNAKQKSAPQNIGGDGKQTFWQKTVCFVTYFFGLTSVLYFLGSAWYFVGMVSLVVSLLVFLISKTKTVKEESGKVFFVSLCGTIISALFWVLYLTTRRYGIGFLSTLFRALQMTGAFLAAALILYYAIEYATHGKVRINWISNFTEKTQEKFSHVKSR